MEVRKSAGDYRGGGGDIGMRVGRGVEGLRGIKNSSYVSWMGGWQGVGRAVEVWK